MCFRPVFLALLLLWPAAASAQQIIESTGSRALGMGGAFVAVADDATAVYWNPAGLASGGPAGMSVGWADFRTGNQRGSPAPGPTRRTSKFISLGTWPIGLSYGRFQESALTGFPGGGTRFDTFTMSQFGATILQTVTPGLVIGSTVKYVRGAIASGLATGVSARSALAAAAEMERPSTGHFDFDLGAMADFRRARLGLTVRNLQQPEFSDVAGNTIKLRRQARLGLAVLPTNGLTLAMDLDLDTADLRDGPRRILALGGENRFGHRWALRGGVRWSLEGSQQTVGAVGLSLGVRRNLWLDGHYTQGRLEADRGFGGALRAGF
jgi:hypothetical protein